MNLQNYFNLNIEITGITSNSRKVKPGYLFACIKGINNDGHKYAADAISRGAVCIISSKNLDVDAPNIVVDDVAKVFSKLCNDFYNRPSEHLKVIGITGTDGKTTTTSIINQMLNQVSSSGYIGTNGIMYRDKNYMLGHITTPECDELFAVLHDMVEADVEYVNLEVTSHALVLKRTDDVKFDVLGITNVTSEHLDFHNSVTEYLEAKRSILDYDARVKILNVDDPNYEYLSANLDDYLTYGLHNEAMFRACEVEARADGIAYTLVHKEKSYSVNTKLIGEFNVYNTLLAIAVCNSYGFSIEKCVEMLENVEPVAGRANFIDCNQNFKVIVDFAHTAASVEQIITYFKNVIGENKIIVVIGSAGDRDKTKRKEIGKAVSSLADYAIYTNEDPRSEDEMQILKDIAVGSVNDNYELIVERTEAIARAFEIASQDDIVLLLGKGVENSIEYSYGEVEYDEATAATAILEKMFN